jgi:hypothetical protein
MQQRVRAIGVPAPDAKLRPRLPPGRMLPDDPSGATEAGRSRRHVTLVPWADPRAAEIDRAPEACCGLPMPRLDAPRTREDALPGWASASAALDGTRVARCAPRPGARG